jgi:hypothetical protein
LVSGSEYKYAWAVAPGGTAPSQPKFTITIPAGGPYGMSKLWVINNSLSPPLKLVIIKAFAANDVIEIDSSLFETTVNDEIEVRGVGRAGRADAERHDGLDK